MHVLRVGRSCLQAQHEGGQYPSMAPYNGSHILLVRQLTRRKLCILPNQKGRCVMRRASSAWVEQPDPSQQVRWATLFHLVRHHLVTIFSSIYHCHHTDVISATTVLNTNSNKCSIGRNVPQTVCRKNTDRAQLSPAALSFKASAFGSTQSNLITTVRRRILDFS
jgi:hypothetical protein